MKSSRFLFCTSMALAVVTGAQAATVYDAVSDFSGAANSASSRWSYRSSVSAAHDGNYPLLPNFGPLAGYTGPPSGTTGWSVPGLPAIGINSSGADQYFIGFGPGAQFTWLAGALLMHPGSPTLAVVSWLSPEASTVSISFQFADLDANTSFPDGVAWAVEKNSGAGVLASGSFLNGGSSGALNISNVTVAAGDRIQFIVGGTGDFQGDSTRLMATITATPVPEPASWALGLAGTAGLLAWRRRQRRVAAR
jgi:hypothetical protein